MATLQAISRLYENVLQYELSVNDISLSHIKAGVQSMAYVYAPFTSDFQSKDTKFANFNDPACRCAYLHKYAPLHTYIVQDVMKKILKTVPGHFQNLLVENSDFNICSLGGGPGSDVIGVLTALLSTFGPFHSSITIIDCMKKWEDTVALIMHELSVRPFGKKSRNFWSYNNNCQWNYIECNLLCSMTNEVNNSIAAASVITMVKFVSAAICVETENMVDKIFQAVKPGALVLFIDNAAGGFTQIVERSGKRNGLIPIVGPLRHVEYQAEALKVERFGYTSCFRTKVTIILMQKLLNHQQNKGNLNSLLKNGQNATFAKSPGPVNSLGPNNRSKTTNTASPCPSGVTSKSPAVVMPQKQISKSAVGQNGTGGDIKSNSNPVRPSTVSNVTDFSRSLQKTSATATAQTKSNVPQSATPTIGFSSLDKFHTSVNSNENWTHARSTSRFEQPRPTAIVSPKSPTRFVSPLHDHSSRSSSRSSSEIATNRPLVNAQRGQQMREVDDDSEETGCSCCSIS